jgi:hypothetical protein
MGCLYLAATSNRYSGWQLRQKKQSAGAPLPRIKILAQKMNIEKDYNHFRFSFEVPQKQCFISAMVDTGCLSGLAGFQIVVYPPKISSQLTQDAPSRQP